MLAEWANRGLNQWTISTGTQTVTEGTNNYQLGTSTIDILDVTIRRTVGTETTDIRMDRLSRSEYFSIPNKDSKGETITIFLRQANKPSTLSLPCTRKFY